MLESVAVVLRVVIELVGVREEIAAGTEGVAAAHVRTRQSDLLGLVYGEDILGVAVQRFATL